MNAPLRPELAALQKASRQAAIATILGAVILFASLGFSGYKLHHLNQTSTALQTQIEQQEQLLTEREQALQSKLAEMNALDEQIKILREQKDNLLTVMRKPYSSGSPKNHVSAALNASTGAALPIEAVVIPRADARRTGETYSNGKRKVQYWLWLDIPDGRKKEIAAVDYFFNHPTFNNQHMTGDPATPGFRVDYIGWGCMNHLVITLKLKNGDSRVLDFDMCEGIWGSDQRGT